MDKADVDWSKTWNERGNRGIVNINRLSPDGV